MLGLATYASYTVTKAFENTAQTASGGASSISATVPGTGGIMSVVSPAGTQAVERTTYTRSCHPTRWAVHDGWMGVAAMGN